MKRAVSVLVFLLVALPAASQTEKAPAILPPLFAGWQRTSLQVSHDPAVADPTAPDLLKEYGFTDLETAVYARPERKITVKAARFRDASGAYGAFTYYKTPDMQTEKIGDQGASANERVLFYRGNVLVQATLDRITAMSAAELRELAGMLPLPQGSARNLPVLPAYLPRQGYVPHSAKYVMGPVGLATLEIPLSAQQVDFGQGAEVATGKYRSGEGVANLILIGYPTPQIAGARLRTLLSAHPQAAENAPLPPGGEFAAKRSGPIVAVVSGAISAREAKSLLASINYDAEVTWNQSTGLGKRENLGSLLVGVILLVVILLGFSLVAGLAFGGFRLLMKRLFPNRVFDRSRDVEIIELKIGPLR
jgi:hypothetical protein